MLSPNTKGSVGYKVIVPYIDVLLTFLKTIPKKKTNKNNSLSKFIMMLQIFYKIIVSWKIAINTLIHFHENAYLQKKNFKFSRKFLCYNHESDKKSPKEKLLGTLISV